MATKKSPQDHDGSRVLPETDQDSTTKCSTSDLCSLSLSSTATSSASPAPLRPKSSQPDPSMLVSLGIKVRDFAYESTLPPIAPVPRVPRQVQPGPRPLKRARRDSNENEDESFSQSSVPQAGPSTSNAGESEGVKKSKPLERKPTEPASDTTSTRARAFTDLSHRESSTSTALQPQSSSIQFPADSTSMTDTQSIEHSQPSVQFDPYESEPYIHTPLVTPNGSLQWPVPSFQLEDGLRTPIPKLILCSPRGLPSEDSRTDEPLLRDTSPVAVSLPPDAPSLLLLPSPSLTDFSKTVRPTSPLQTSQHTAHPDTNSENQSQSTIPGPTSPRYFLRKRSAASPQTPPRPSRARPSRPHPSPRQHFSVQAAHSRSGRDSPSARTLRRNGKEESLVMS